MSAQIIYSLKQAVIMAALAFLGYVLANQDVFFGTLDQTSKLLVVGALPLLVRVFEGWRDGVRAKDGKVQDADVVAAEPEVVSHPYADDPHLAVNQELAAQEDYFAGDERF